MFSTLASARAAHFSVGACFVLALAGCTPADKAAPDVDATAYTPVEPATSGQTAPSPAATSTTVAPLPDWAPKTTRDKVALLMMPGVSNYDDALAKLNAGVGGIFITSWADPALLTEPGRDIAALREAVGRPFDVAIDFEGGRVQRFSEVFGSYLPPQQLAATHSPEQAEEYAYGIGKQLAARGITVNFAPVLDIDAAGLAIVGDRAFSADPQLAADYGVAFARGMQRAGIEPVFKHYPGHGRASGDTHLNQATTPHLNDLTGSDLVPFIDSIAESPAAGVMVGHLVVPGLGAELKPASINDHAYGLLRNYHDFTGVAYTDDLTGMAAITDHYTPEQAVALAIGAGADQALWSTAVDINAVIDFAEHASVDPQRLEAAVARMVARLDTLD
ncbi:MAG: glycoside hydrolase family 3 N-terminal domain-containing protein [Corynebacterium sp.]|nr:glycoside hydrolase family 3 N-terminal domain-containing protein [Corynebacterium sp.]